MGSLPLLVTHGAWLGKLVLVGVVAGTLGLGYARRRRRARTAAARATSARRAAVTELREGAVTLRGTLRDGSIESTRVGADVTCGRTGAPYLDCQGTRVELPATVHVIRGTHTTSPRFRAKPTQTTRVGDGDDVLVTGTLARSAVDGELDYRASAATWALAGDPDVEIAALTPHVMPLPQSVSRFVFSIAAVAIVTFGLQAFAGRIALRAEREWRSTGGELHVPSSLAIAAMMPSSRMTALAKIDNMFERDFEKTDATARAHAELDALRTDEPCIAAHHRQRESKHAEALLAARACGDRRVEVASLISLGRYDEATAIPLPDHPQLVVVAAIGAGNWKVAADGVMAVARDRADDEITAGYLSADDRREVVDRLHCIAAVFRMYGGAKTAFEEPTATHCTYHKLLALSDAEQVAAFAALEERAVKDHDVAPLGITYELALAAGGRVEHGWMRGLDSLAFGVRARTWLVQFRTGPLEGRDSLRYDRAELAVIRGDFASARADLAVLAADPEASRYVESLRFAIALHTGERFERDPTQYLHPAFVSAERTRALTTKPEGQRDECSRDGAVAHAVTTGDGLPLAHYLARCNPFWSTIDKDILAAIPSVKTHRQELAEALRHFRRVHYGNAELPFDMLDEALYYRSFATLSGDPTEAAIWQGIIDRHSAALAKRDRATAMFLWAGS